MSRGMLSPMAWVYVIKNGCEAEWQAVPPSENTYDFLARFVQRRADVSDSELYAIDEGAGLSSPMTVEEVTSLKYLLGIKNANRS